MGFESGTILRVAMRATASGHAERVMTFHYNLDDASVGLEANDPQDLADRFRDDVVPGFRAWFTAAWTLQPTVVTQEIDPQDPTAPRSQWTSGTTLVGTGPGSSDDLPYGVCALVKLVTGVVGRRFNGRSFCYIPLNENSQTAGLLSSGMITALQGLYDSIPIEPDIAGGGGLSDARARLCVYSRTARALNQDPYATDVTGFTVRQATHYLRRRAS
jgi:hypothetical protein